MEIFIKALIIFLCLQSSASAAIMITSDGTHYETSGPPVITGPGIEYPLGWAEMLFPGILTGCDDVTWWDGWDRVIYHLATGVAGETYCTYDVQYIYPAAKLADPNFNVFEFEKVSNFTQKIEYPGFDGKVSLFRMFVMDGIQVAAFLWFIVVCSYSCWRTFKRISSS